MRYRVATAMLLGLALAPLALAQEQAIDRSPAALRQKLQPLLHRLASDGKHVGVGVLWVEDHKKIMWFQGQAVALLSAAYPYAAEADKPALAAYLKREVVDYLLDPKYMQWERTGTLTRPGNETLKWEKNNATGWMAIYGIFAYARATGDWDLVKEKADTIKGLWQTMATPPTQIVASRSVARLWAAHYNGAFAMAQIAQRLGDETLTAPGQGGDG